MVHEWYPHWSSSRQVSPTLQQLLITDSHRPLHRRHHRHFPDLARHLLAPNCFSRCCCAAMFLPAARNHPRETIARLQGLPAAKKAHKMWQWLNPFRVIRLYRYPNLFLVVSVFVSSMRTRGQFADEAPTRLCRLLHWSGTCTPCLLLSAMFSTRGSTSNHLSSPVYSILLQAVDTSSEPSSVAGMPITS